MTTTIALESQRSGSIAAHPRAMVVPLERRALRSVISGWQRAADLSAAAPFAHPAFVLATARHLSSGEHRIVAATQGAKIVGALPLTKRGRTLVGVESMHTPRFDYVGERAGIPTVWNALMAMPGWDVLRLSRVPRGSWLVSDLPAIAEDSGCRVVMQPHIRSPRFSLRDFESRLTSKFRGELRRAAQRLGAIEYERLSRFDSHAFEAALAIELSAWKGQAGTAIACDTALRRFYETIIRWASIRGALTIGFLRCNDRRIAMHLAVESDGTYYLLKPGYDPEFSANSPGQLMMKLAAEDARARGLHTCDLLGRDEAWKMKWTDTVEEHVYITVYRGTPLGQARFVASERCRPLAGRVRRWMRDQVTPRRSES